MSNNEPFWTLRDRRKRAVAKSVKKHEPTKGPSVIVKEKVVKQEHVVPISVKPMGTPDQFDIPDPLMTHEAWRFLTRNHDWERRRKYTEKNGWFIPTEETVGILAEYLKDKKVLEVASGTGYLAAHLRQRGVADYTAVDLYVNYWEVDSPNYGSTVGDALEHVNQDYNVVVMAWPPYNAPFGRKVVQQMRGGQTLVLQGEGWGGCTGSDQMFQALDDYFVRDDELTDRLNEHHIQFESIHDEWTVYHHKAVKAVQK